MDNDVAMPENEQMNRPFSKYELGVIVLRACPRAWEEQYYLLCQSLPTKLGSVVKYDWKVLTNFQHDSCSGTEDMTE